MRFDDRILHTAQLAMVLLTAMVLIIFAHNWLPPNIVFTSLVAGAGSIVGSRIAANGYIAANSNDKGDSEK